MTGPERVVRESNGRAINVLLAGVGGQGVLAASETLALAAMAEGLQVKQSEVHGVAQRGGSVVSHVRFGDRVYSPLIPSGEADLLCAGERLEALRYAHHLRPGGRVVMDDRVIKPIQLADQTGAPYPEGVPEFLRAQGIEVRVCPALGQAVELGEQRCANIVLLGLVSTWLPLSAESWQTAIEQRFPPGLRDLNQRAFAAGRGA